MSTIKNFCSGIFLGHPNVAKYEKTAPKLSAWMEENLSKGLTVFALATEHRQRLRTTNMLERVHEETKRRILVAGLFPNEASLLRLASAILTELSEEWETGRRYLNMDVENAKPASNRRQIYRKKGCATGTTDSLTSFLWIGQQDI